MGSSQQTLTAASLNLATARQKQGISLEQIAEATKISMRFLRAIEDEQFEKLPGGIFNTSYLRQYAAAAGLEPGELLAQYIRAVQPEPPPAAPAPPRSAASSNAGFASPRKRSGPKLNSAPPRIPLFFSPYPY